MQRWSRDDTIIRSLKIISTQKSFISIFSKVFDRVKTVNHNVIVQKMFQLNLSEDAILVAYLV